ncbi:DUF5793 family protein [Halobacterium wangiae]|uniref:DUF5793 family protein n=1 Tax=Halobacterium wangiae TaxID=2902623 RepID=UPI001E2D0C2F|nr:DUF5793 family protein [Halobacterium wangiae]
MRRDYFELDVTGVDWVDEGGEPSKPNVVIEFTGDVDDLRDHLTDNDGELLDAGETDATFRLTDDVEERGASGVVAVTNRITGDFVLELNEDAEDVFTFIRAARRYGEATDDDEGRYRVEIRVDGEELVVYDKSTFLVYSRDGDLLRGDSLIPSGIEL